MAAAAIGQLKEVGNAKRIKIFRFARLGTPTYSLAGWSSTDCYGHRLYSHRGLNPLARGNLHVRPWGLVFAAMGVAALIGVVVGTRSKRDGLPFAMTVLFFLSAFFTLSAMFWPYIIPYAITVGNGAAPDASLSFLFYGAVVILPVVIIYTLRVYWIFRGKIRPA